MFTTPGLYSPVVIETDTTSGDADTLLSSDYAIYYLMSDSCALITGNFYKDNNHNCNRDTNESLIGSNSMAWASFYLPNTTAVSSATDRNGRYSVQLPKGYIYAVTPTFYADSNSTSLVYIPYASCPDSGNYTLNITSTAAINNIDFGYRCDTSSLIDGAAYVFDWKFRPGFQRHVYVYAGSTAKLCDTVSATVTLTLDSRLTFDSLYYGLYPNTISGNTLTWNISSVNGLADFMNDLLVTCSTNAVIGDSICNTISVTTTNYTDTNSLNNTNSYCTEVTNSLDPNEKAVLPKGAGAQGYVDRNTKLNYIINFQNTGNDTAYNVVVTDTLDAAVDTNSIQMLETSHPATMSRSGRVVNFSFANIMLPDSGKNEATSQGFVMYSILPKSNLAPNTPLSNKAYIYFDNNVPVITNTTLNTIQWPAKVTQAAAQQNDITIYPNPANGELFVKAGDDRNFGASLLDITGRIVKTGTSSGGRLTINVSPYPAGIYLLKVNEKGNVQTFKVCVQH